MYTIHPKPVKFKASPDKPTVHRAMVNCKVIADYKSMPFIQLVGDQPVFTLITELKNEKKENV